MAFVFAGRYFTEGKMADMDLALTIPKDKKDPKYRYAFVLDEPKTQTIYKMLEYEHVKVSDPDGSKFKDDPRLQPDGKIRVGDVVLMRCREETVQAREAASRKRNSGRLPAIKEEFHGAVSSMGIRTFEDPTQS